ncbi:MAG: DNA mismatch repair endonuclease MutL [Firmicutes bacterium]|nr:DNA mismatch repair endonuclease MutL [Bacillota bacterium]
MKKMSEINVLDSKIFNRIAAGEVVDSPASIVKELVENSIDAKANSISIKIEQGGIKRISITDNGKGLFQSDLEKAFLPHATSKIKTLNDLNAIKTLGFRGEALASIASVAKVTMVSRREGEDMGYFVSYENGVLVEKGERASQFGTTVVVEDLFKNVPARAKFLKKPSSEASSITDLVQKLTLANVEISFKYTNEEKCVLHSQGDGLKKAIYAVYGDVLSDLNEVSSYLSDMDIKVKGFASKIGHFKHNRSYQIFVVNGRVVECSELSYYMFVLYKDFLMTRSYPMFVVHLNLPHDTIDVNVHPNKMQVKFTSLDKVKSALSKAIRPSLRNELFVNDSENEDVFESVTSNVLFSGGEHSLAFNGLIDSKSEVVFKEPKNSVGVVPEISVNYSSANAKYSSSQQASEIISHELTSFVEIKQKPKIIGKLFSTYLIIEHHNNVYFVDQHAAHERILFDEFIGAYLSNELHVQDLLAPFMFEIPNTMRDILCDFIPKLEEAGFRISEISDNIYSLSSVPQLFSLMSLKDFVDILIIALKSGEIKNEDFVRDKIAMSACKAAVKGNHELSSVEVENLLKQLEEHDGVMLCPHGRPVLVKHSKLDLEKWFKRKV